MKFNEDSRVKIPSILHLTRLGYKYLSLKDAVWDESSNIFTDIFKESIAQINLDIEEHDISRLLQDATLALDNEDLGKAFYEQLIDQSGFKLIDFSNFDNNSFHVVTELTYRNGDEEFRPDIILLINGMPLTFIEVKKPNNREGVLVERKRINTRFKNKRFRRFVNITQFMVFSNNMEYDDYSSAPIEGAFYASPSYKEITFNYFREEENKIITTFNAKSAIDDFSVVLSYDDIAAKNYSLSAGQYFEVKIEYVDITNEEFTAKMNTFEENLTNMFDDGKDLEKEIMSNLKGLTFEEGTTDGHR